MLSGPTHRRQSKGGLRRSLQQRAFAALYGPLARWYDRFTRWLFLGEWERWQREVLPLLPVEGLVIELGCGTGRLAAAAAGAGRRWVALDRSPAMVRQAAQRVRRSGGIVVRADARRLPIPTAAAAAVVATFPSDYILHPGTQAEIVRVLQPGGTVAVVLGGRLTPTTPRRRARMVALAAFYGRQTPAPGPLTIRGIAGGTIERPTRHGVASLYVGTATGESDQTVERL